MKVKIINPNTTLSMTQKINDIAKKYARPETEIIAVSPEKGPVSIEDAYDATLAGPEVLKEIKKGINDGFDGFIIACFGDPALFAAREVTNVPVMGIAEAAMLMACSLGAKFSVITMLKRHIPATYGLVNSYGLSERCASVRVINASVLEFEHHPEKYTKVLLQEAQKAIADDGAEVILLGCAGLVNLDEQLEKELQVPVIDGVVAAVKYLEAIFEYGKTTSKVLSYRPPEKKQITGYPDILQP